VDRLSPSHQEGPLGRAHRVGSDPQDTRAALAGPCLEGDFRSVRLIVPDDQAVLSFCASGARHRTVVTWWLLKNYRWVDVTPGFEHAKPDRNALAIEIFWHYLAQLESLEMTYFALRDKARNPSRPLFAIYVHTTIVEHFKKARPGPTSYSGRRILFELRGISPDQFVKQLGLPTYEQMTLACCGAAPITARISKGRYKRYLKQEISWLRRMLRNKNRRYLHQAYIRFKHGFAVLGHPESDEVFVINKAARKDRNRSTADVIKLNTAEDFVFAIARDVDRIGSLIIRLWGMYLGRSPCERCERCECQTNGDDDWMIRTSAREFKE